jgi:hypothetical protein
MSSEVSRESEGPLPNLHDGNFVGMVLLADKRCVLFVADTLGTVHNLTLSGIEGLRADNFLHGNLVLHVTVQTGEAVSDDDILFALSIENDRVDEHRAYLDGILGRIRSRNLSLVQIYASYGCTFSCVCTQMSPNAAQRDDVIHALGI